MKLYTRFSGLSRGWSTFKKEVEISVKNLLFQQVEKLRRPPGLETCFFAAPKNLEVVIKIGAVQSGANPASRIVVGFLL